MREFGIGGEQRVSGGEACGHRCGDARGGEHVDGFIVAVGVGDGGEQQPHRFDGG